MVELVFGEDVTPATCKFKVAQAYAGLMRVMYQNTHIQMYETIGGGTCAAAFMPEDSVPDGCGWAGLKPALHP